MNRLKLTIALFLGALTATAANIDYHALETNFFTTNGYYVGLNTNAGSSLYTFTTNIAQGGGISAAVNTNLTAVTNGSLVTLSGLAQVWTNDPAWKLGFSGPAIHQITNAEVSIWADLTNAIDVTALNVNLTQSGTNFSGSSFGLFVNSRVQGTGTSQIEDFDTVGNGAFGMLSWVSGITSPPFTGDYVGVMGISDVITSNRSFGVIGLAAANGNNSTNVGGLFTARTSGFTGQFVGVYARLAADDSAQSRQESSAIIGDNGATGLPLFTARTNNGSHVFQVTAAGDLAFPLTTWKSPTNGTAGQVLQTDGGTPQQLSWTTVSGGPASPQIWITNVPEGGIMWSNLNGNAKFGPLATGTFVAGYTNNTGKIKADFNGSIAMGDADGTNSIIYSDDLGSLAGGHAVAGGNVTADLGGAIAWGEADGASSKLYSDGHGAVVFGNATAGANITADYVGSLAFGYATGVGSQLYDDSAGGLTVGSAKAGGVVQNNGGDGGIAAGYSTGASSKIENRSNGGFAGGIVDVGGLIQTGNGASGGIAYGYGSAGSLVSSGAATFVFGEADEVGSLIEDNGEGSMTLGRAQHVSKVDSEGSGSLNVGFADFSSWVHQAGSGSIGGGYATGTNSQVLCYPDGSLLTGRAQEGANVTFGTAFPVYQGGDVAAVMADSGGRVSMTPAVGCFLVGYATAGGTLSADGTNTFTFGQNVGNTANYAYSFGLNYTNTQDRSLNVGWSSAPSVTVWTNKIVLATDEGGNGVAERFHCSGAVVTLSTGSAVKYANITLPTNGTLGLTISVWTKATGGSSDIQSVKETFAVAAINKTGTITSSVSASTPIATITSAGTLTTAFTAVINGNGLDLKETATTSLSSPTVICGWRMDIDSDYQPTVTQ